MNSHRTRMSRRSFVKSACAGMSGTTLLSSFGGLLSATALAQDAGQGVSSYKALVCILLAGGNDSFNMLVPNENATYAEYQSARSDLALARAPLLGIAPAGGDTRAYGLHPRDGQLPLQRFCEDGKAKAGQP